MSRAPELRRKRAPAKPAGPPKPAGDEAPPAPDEREARDLDAKIDEAVAESFPASDPPAWTPGVV